MGGTPSPLVPETEVRGEQRELSLREPMTTGKASADFRPGSPRVSVYQAVNLVLQQILVEPVLEIEGAGSAEPLSVADASQHPLEPQPVAVSGDGDVDRSMNYRLPKLVIPEFRVEFNGAIETTSQYPLAPANPATWCC